MPLIRASLICLQTARAGCNRCLCARDQSIWAGANDEHSGLSETGHIRLQDDGRYHWDARTLQPIAGNTTGVIHDDGGDVLWFGGPFGLVRHQLTAAKNHGGILSRPAEACGCR